MSPEIAQPSLNVVNPKAKDRPQKLFCGHCGRSPADSDAETPSRVCANCGMGLMLQAPADVAPSVDDPFVVVDSSLTICAVSRVAEKLLGVAETDAVHRHVGEFLVPADTEAPTSENLGALVAWAARGESPSTSVVVRPANTFGVRYWARVGPCGPPQAALLVLADAR
jgi:PAS domain-containing protein